MGEEIPLTATSNNDSGATSGFLLVGGIRALLVGLKKGAITTYVRKHAFLQISSRAMGTKKSTEQAIHPIKQWKLYSKKLIKNSLLGIAVFGTYELIAFKWFGNTKERIKTLPVQRSNSSFSIDSSVRSIVAGSTPIMVHSGAGLCAGVAHSGVIVTWDYLIPRITMNNMQQLRNFSWQHMVHNKSRLMFQHSIGYSSLFGTYEATRRLLEFSLYDVLAQQEEEVFAWILQVPEQYTSWMKHDGIYDIRSVHILISFLAGGLAGQVHHVVSHVVANHHHNGSGSILKRLPTIRSTLPSIWITGLCFIAFEHGGDLAERLAKPKQVS